MLLICLGIWLVLEVGIPAEAYLCCATLGGAVLAATALRARAPTRDVVPLLALEEVAAAGLFSSPSPALPWPEAQGLAFVAALAATGLLLLRAPLPEALFPLRGVWLRRFLAAAALFGLAQFGPWLYIWRAWGVAGWAQWPLVPALIVACWLLWIAGSLLVRGVDLPRGLRAALKASPPPA
jgi:hypothetical protein